MKKIIKNLTLSGLCILSIASCGSQKVEEDVFDKSLMDNYTIVKKEELKEQKVCQTSPFVNADITHEIKVTVDWKFPDGPALFFNNKCPFTRNEVASFLLNINDSYDFVLGKEKIQCDGLPLHTYTPKISTSPLTMTTNISGIKGSVATFVVANMTKYEITNKTTAEKFDVFYTCNSYVMTACVQ